MSVHYGSNIITTDMLCCLDAGHPRSYPGTGNIWYDLTKNGYNATLSGNVEFENGGLKVVDNQTTDVIIAPVEALNAINLANQWIIELILSIDESVSITQDKYFMSFATSSDNNYILLHIKGNNIFIFGENELDGSGIDYTPGVPFQMFLISDNSFFWLYKNGEFMGRYNQGNDVRQTEGWTLNQEQDSVLGGYDQLQCTAMTVYALRVYNNDRDIPYLRLNSEAMKRRFNL